MCRKILVICALSGFPFFNFLNLLQYSLILNHRAVFPLFRKSLSLFSKIEKASWKRCEGPSQLVTVIETKLSTDCNSLVIRTDSFSVVVTCLIAKHWKHNSCVLLVPFFSFCWTFEYSSLFNCEMSYALIIKFVLSMLCWFFC